MLKHLYIHLCFSRRWSELNYSLSRRKLFIDVFGMKWVLFSESVTNFNLVSVRPDINKELVWGDWNNLRVCYMKIFGRKLMKFPENFSSLARQDCLTKSVPRRLLHSAAKCPFFRQRHLRLLERFLVSLLCKWFFVRKYNLCFTVTSWPLS